MLDWLLRRPFTAEDEEEIRDMIQKLERFLALCEESRARRNDDTVTQLEKSYKFQLGICRAVAAWRRMPELKKKTE